MSDAASADHDVCLDLLGKHPGPLLVPSLCIAETAQILGARGSWGSEVRFLAALASGGLIAENLHPSDFERMGELVGRYRDLPLGTVDASVVAAAERLGVTEIATLDRRHFSVVRPRHVEAFTLLP